MDQVEQTAPAQLEQTPPPAEPISAIDQAVIDGDQSAFKAAQRAERAGTPLPPVEAKKTPEPPEPAAPAPQISKRQQQINDYERRIAEQDQRIRALEAGQASPAAPRSQPSPSAPAPTPQAEYKRFLALPDAPRLEQFESVDEHTAAMSLFIADKRIEEHVQRAQQDQARTHADQARVTRDTAFTERMTEVKKADPEFLDRISPDVLALKPFDALKDGEVPTASNAIAEEILRSPYGPQLMQHLTDHQGELTRLQRLGPSELHLELGELRATFKQAAKPAPQTRHLTAAPPPPTTLGSKPAVPADAEEAAVASGDQRAFKAEFLRKQTAHLR